MFNAYCATCGKVSFLNYLPPPEWNVKGTLCKDCFESVNIPVMRITSEKDRERACSQCNENIYQLKFSSKNLCILCFTKEYGETIQFLNKAEYYGGHKAYLAGGLVSEFQLGKLYLTKTHLIFFKGDRKPEKRWEIIIPLKSVITKEWQIQESSRRKTVYGGGIGVPVAGIGIGGGMGFIEESGKSHRLVIAYFDEANIPHTPKFGISSIGGNAIKKWALMIYELIKQNQTESKQSQVDNEGEDMLATLKKRLVRGEITLEEFEKLKKVIE